MDITQDLIAEKLLWGIWRSIDDVYKERYLSNIWEQFENAIRSAAYTDNLKKFISNLKVRLPMVILAKYNSDILSVIDSGKDSIILGWLRDETTYLVMKVRIINQDRKAQFEELDK